MERGVVGLGIDTPGWHLEGLAGLESLPARGALLLVGALSW